tara:strand:- start:1350 stop:1733 length:384 start_codon:yes stop_codon:yes gene_type:complete
MSIKKWIIGKLRYYSGVEQLTLDLNNALSRVDRIETRLTGVISDLLPKIKESVWELEGTIKNTLSLVADINTTPYEDSFVMLCYKKNGKDIVHKIPIRDGSGADILSILVGFSSASKTIDSPMGFMW